MVFNTTKKFYSTLTPTRVEGSTVFSVPDSFFHPKIKEKEVGAMHVHMSVSIIKGYVLYNKISCLVVLKQWL